MSKEYKFKRIKTADYLIEIQNKIDALKKRKNTSLIALVISLITIFVGIIIGSVVLTIISGLVCLISIIIVANDDVEILNRKINIVLNLLKSLGISNSQETLKYEMLVATSDENIYSEEQIKQLKNLSTNQVIENPNYNEELDMLFE